MDDFYLRRPLIDADYILALLYLHIISMHVWGGKAVWAGGAFVWVHARFLWENIYHSKYLLYDKPFCCKSIKSPLLLA